MLFRLLMIIAAALPAGCRSVTTTTTAAIAPSSLAGVWEVTACESLFPRRAASPATIPNDKYCFGSGMAYPELAADAPNDSADGGGDYYIAGKNILVIRTPAVLGGLYCFQLISVSGEQLVWLRDDLRVTLRRVARTWDGGDSPVLPSRNVPVSYPP